MEMTLRTLAPPTLWPPWWKSERFQLNKNQPQSFPKKGSKSLSSSKFFIWFILWYKPHYNPASITRWHANRYDNLGPLTFVVWNGNFNEFIRLSETSRSFWFRVMNFFFLVNRKIIRHRRLSVQRSSGYKVRVGKLSRQKSQKTL